MKFVFRSECSVRETRNASSTSLYVRFAGMRASLIVKCMRDVLYLC